MVKKENSSHEPEWRGLRKFYSELSKKDDDIYDNRAKACARLLTQYCQI